MNNRQIYSLLITLTILVLLYLSGPGSAVLVHITTDKTAYGSGDSSVRRHQLPHGGNDRSARDQVDRMVGRRGSPDSDRFSRRQDCRPMLFNARKRSVQAPRRNGTQMRSRDRAAGKIPERSIMMPGFDRTGPVGQGSRTGWGRGPCGSRQGRGTSFLGGFFGGVGRGGAPWGGGRGRCFGSGKGWWGRGAFFGSAPTPEQEAEALKAELSAARSELAAMEARLEELKKEE